MRTNTRTAVYSAAAVFLSFLFYIMPDTVTDAVSRALSVCALRVIPAVFPFTVISSFFIKSGGADRIDALLSRPFHAIFGLSCGASALFCGLFFGFPLGAMCVGSLHSSGKIDKSEAARLLTFCACASPTYPVFAVGKGMFGSVGTGIMIWCVTSAVSVAIGFSLNILRPIGRPYKQSVAACTRTLRLPEAVTASVADASRIMLNVCGSVTFFSLIGRVTSEMISAITESPYAALFVSSVFEFASGCAHSAEAYSSGLVNRSDALAISTFAIGFSGLSVICQNASVLPHTRIALLPHIVSKFITGLLSCAVVYFLSSRIDSGINASVDFDTASFSPVALIPSAVIVLIFVLTLIKNQKSA